MWILVSGTGFAVIYGLNLPQVLFHGKQLSKAESAAYGGIHRLAWGVAVGWVVFACCRGYGGNVELRLSQSTKI